MKTHIQRLACTIFTTALFMIAKRWKQPKHWSAGERTNETGSHPSSGTLHKGMKDQYVLQYRYYVDKPLRHDAERQKRDMKGHIVHSYVHKKYPGQTNLERQEAGKWMPGAGGGTRQDC